MSRRMSSTKKFLEFSAHIYRETLPVNREMSIFEGL